MLYEQQAIRTDVPFAQLRKSSFLSERAKNSQGNDFSQSIREGMFTTLSSQSK